MKILLDHCVPKPFKHQLPGHEVSTARDLGWEALKNGELLKRAAADGFQVLITVDQNLRYQLNLRGASIAVLVLNAGGITVEHLQPLVGQVQELLTSAETGKIYEVTA